VSYSSFVSTPEHEITIFSVDNLSERLKVRDQLQKQNICLVYARKCIIPAVTLQRMIVNRLINTESCFAVDQMATSIEKLRIACLQRGASGIHGIGRYTTRDSVNTGA